MEDLAKYIIEEELILIPVLYVIGTMLKNLEKISDKYIPLILLVVGIVFSIALCGLSINSVIQGILITGVTVYTNQLIKQISK